MPLIALFGQVALKLIRIVIARDESDRQAGSKMLCEFCSIIVPHLAVDKLADGFLAQLRQSIPFTESPQAAMIILAVAATLRKATTELCITLLTIPCSSYGRVA